MPGKIFINYRRSDSLKDAFLIAARLKDRYGARNVFLDENLSGGQVFPQVLEKRLAQCSVMLTIIGPRWLDATGDDGARRLANPDDWVRHEIRRALARKIALVPVLINGAAMPPKSALPDDIAGLADHHAVPVRTADHGFRGDMSVLIEAIDGMRGRVHWPAVGAGLATLLLVGWGVAYQQGVPVWVPSVGRGELGRPDGARGTGDVGSPASTRSEADAKSAADKAQAERDAKLIADAEARIRAEIAAKQKAETDLRQREAAAKAEADRKQAVADAEAAARAKAEAVARAKAEADRVQAAALAKQRAVEEAARRDPLLALTPGSGQAARDRLANGQPCPMCPEMVVAPAGSFAMGSTASEIAALKKEFNSDWYASEAPQRRVTISSAFAVGKFAVTFDEWDACVADGGCNGYKPADQGWGRGKRPVINVHWDDAKAYAKWLSAKTGKSYRLLSEAEREYVARAGTTTAFWWGPSISTRQANYDGNFTFAGSAEGEYRAKTMPVDSFDANPWGLYQVHGNVYDWTEDCWHANYQGAPSDGSAWTTACTDSGRRVVRGGSWNDVPQNLRSAFRYWLTSDFRDNYLGFRVGRTLSP